MKKTKASKTAHTANTKYGMGDYYGTGVRAKLAKERVSKPSKTLPQAS